MTAPGEIPPAALAALLRVGHEVARRARALGAERLCVELAGSAGPLLFTRLAVAKVLRRSSQAGEVSTEPPRLLPRRANVRPLALALLMLLLAPVAAASMQHDARVRVRWNSTPDGVRARGTWDARLSLLQGPGGFDPGSVQPVIVITEVASGAERRMPMIVDVPPNTFRATVEFPRAGLYDVAATGFDPRDPKRFTDLAARVRVGPAPVLAARGASDPWWSWALFVAAVVAGAWCMQRVRARAARRRR